MLFLRKVSAGARKNVRSTSMSLEKAGKRRVIRGKRFDGHPVVII